VRVAVLALLAVLPQAAPKEDKKQLDRRIEELFARLVSEKDEPARAAARAELEALGRPVLPVLKRFLDDELARAKKAKEKAETIADRYVPRLDDDAVESREAAMLALIERGEEILPGLKKYERSSSAEIRGRVAQVVKAIEARRAGGRPSRVAEDALLLFARLSDPAGAATVAGFFEGRDPELRLQAVKTFHEIALPADLPKLKPLLSDADLKVRAQACVAAADLGLDAAVPMLLDLVRAEKDLNTWRAALNGMARWRALWPPEVSAKVGELIPGAPPDRRLSLLFAYFRAGRLPDPPEALLKVFRTLAPAEKADLLKPWGSPEDPNWIAAAKTLATDPDPAIAGPAAVLYGYAKFFRFSYPVSFLDRYDALPADERLYGIRALARQDRVRTQQAIALLLRETDPALRKALLEAGFENPTFVTGFNLREALLSGQPDLVRAAAACYHHNCIQEALPAVKYLFLKTADPVTRARLGLAVATEGDPRGIPHLAPFLKDPSPRLRALAAEAVAATQAAELLDGVVPLLKDPDAAVRNAAADALLRSGQARFFEPLWALRTERGMESYAARAAGKFGTAADLEKLMQQNPAARATVPAALFHLSPMEPHPLLLALAQDKDSQVKANAERTLGFVKTAALLPQQVVEGKTPPGDLGFAYASDFVFAAAADCTPKTAAERRAIPIPLKEFLAHADVNDRQFVAGTIFRRAAPRHAPKELLDLLVEGHPRLDAALRLLRSRSYPEAAPLLAALPGANPELARMLSWCDPVIFHARILEGIEKGTIADGGAGLARLSEFLPGDEYVTLLLTLAKHPAPGVKGAADEALARQTPRVLCAMLADGRITDRALVLRSLVRMKVPGTLPTIEESLKDKDPQLRALAAVALVTAKGEEALPAAIPCLKEAAGDVAWELAAKVIVHLKETHRPLLPAEPSTTPLHALLARLGRKESAAKVLADFPSTNPGKLAAGLALAPHYDAAVEAKLAPLLASSGAGFADRDGVLGLAAALGRSSEPATRARVLESARGISILDRRIHPASLDALGGLIEKGEPGAVERAGMGRGVGMPEAREDAIALLLRAGTDEAASFLVEFLNVPLNEMPPSTPRVLEAIRAHAKGPKTGEKLRQILSKGTFLDSGLLAPLFAEMGATAEFEAALEQRAQGTGNYGPSLGAMQILARTPTGVERLKKLAQVMGASKDSRQRTFGGFAALLAGLPLSPEEWRANYLKWGGSEATLLAAQLRLVESVGAMHRRAKDGLSGTHDAGMAAAIPLLACQDLRPPEPSRPDYWPAMSRFLAELGVWVKKNRGRAFEEVFADALRARGLAVAGKAADAAALVAALEDKDDFIAANADWMLRRVSGRAVPPALSIVGDGGLPYELTARYGPTLLTVALGAGRWHVRRPDPDEVAAWKQWLAARN